MHPRVAAFSIAGRTACVCGIVVLLALSCDNGESVEPAPSPELMSLNLSSGVLSPPFSPGVTSYTVTVPYKTESVTLTPVSNGDILVGGTSARSAQESEPIKLSQGLNTIDVDVRSPDGSISMGYTIEVTRTWATAEDVEGSSTSSLRVLYPNGGETLQVGATIKLRLGSDVEENHYVLLYLSLDGGRTKYLLTTDRGIEFTGSATYSFTIPETLEAPGQPSASARSLKCKVYVGEYEAEQWIFDWSDAVFTIE